MIKRDIFQTRPRMIVAPDNDATGKWPIVLFSPGAGQNPDYADLTTVDMLFDNGSPLAWARDGALNGQKDFTTGSTYNFLAVGLQGKNRICAQPWEMDACLTDLLAKFPQADASCILVGGLSAGGQVTWQFAGSPYGKRAILAVPMSTPGVGNIDLSLSPKVWAFHGTSDVDPTAFKNSVDYVNGVNVVKSGWAHLTPYAGGHGNWATYFNPNYTEKICTELPAMNIYQAALAMRSQKFLFTTSGTGSTGPTTTPSKMVITAAATLNPDGTATLTIKGSSGVKSFFWRVPAGIGFADGRSDGGETLQDKITSKLQPGNYIFTVEAQDIQGKKANVDIVLSVPGGVILPTPPPPLPVGRKEVARVKMPDVTITGKTAVFYDNGDTEIV
jgi:hypothetical protein